MGSPLREPFMRSPSSNLRKPDWSGSQLFRDSFKESFRERQRPAMPVPERRPAEAEAEAESEEAAWKEELRRRKEKDDNLVVDYKYVAEEAKIQIQIAGPMVLVNLLQYGVLVLAVICAGHLGEVELASSSLANSITSVLGFYILLGMSSTLETLCGQAYGAEQYHKLGIYLQRALLILYATCVPLSLLFFYMEKILLLAGQTPVISAKAGEYAVWLLPALYAYAALQAISRFLQTQSIVVPMVVCSAITLAVHAGLCWFITYTLGMGYPGAALATSISYWFNVLILLGYVSRSSACKKTWGAGLSKEAFSDLRKFLRLGVPATVMICLEYWCFEVMVMLAGLLPNPELELSALSVCLSTVTLNYMIPLGLSAAASTRVANKLGSGEPNAARSAVLIVVGMSLSQAAVVSVTLLLVRNVWGWVFSSEPEVVEYISTIMPIISILVLCDGIQGVLSGVARGAGWLDLGALVNLATFYGLGVPTGVLLAFHFGWAGKGIFTGLIVGLGSQMLTLVAITYFTDWGKRAEEALARNAESETGDDTLKAPLLDGHNV